MKKTELVLSLLMGFLVQSSEASPLLEINCEVMATRAHWGTLNLEIDLLKGELDYSANSYSYHEKDLIFEFQGSNHDTQGDFNARSNVEIISKGPALRIQATGKYFDRATLVKQTTITAFFIKSEKGLHLRDAKLISFNVDGKEFKFPNAQCSLGYGPSSH